jgi:hypothetical protein
MLKKIFKAAKKAAPIIGAGLGYLYGGPMLGSAIGGGLGSLVAGKSPQEALKFAALSGLAGGALSKFGGVQAGQGLGGIFNKPVGTNITREIAGRPMQAATFPKQNILQKGLGYVKKNPIKSALAGLGIATAAGAGGEEEVTSTYEDVYGKYPGFRDLGQADVAPPRLIPYGNANQPYGFSLANGGIISLADGGDFPRKNGKIAGPGTETSDEIPAMLSDGEFVVNARTVRGLGAAMGAEGREDERDRGSKFLYSIQNNYGAKT